MSSTPSSVRHGVDNHSAADAPMGHKPDGEREPVLSVRHLRVEFPTRHATLVALDDVSSVPSCQDLLELQNMLPM